MLTRQVRETRQRGEDDRRREEHQRLWVLDEQALHHIVGFGGRVERHRMETDIRSSRGRLRQGQLRHANSVIPDHANAPERRNDLAEKLKLLAGQFGQIHPDPAHIRARPRQALDEPARDGVGFEINPDDGNRLGGLHGSTDAKRPAHDEDFDRRSDPLTQIGLHGGVALRIAPLSDEETAQLVHALLERPVLEADEQTALLERAGGNPLYAEEFVRMLHDRGGSGLALPETVQGLIAARLDGLTTAEKAVLQASAVLGKVFWLGSAAELAGIERSSAEPLLHALERKEFIRRERQSSVAGESEYAFRHLLVRDVAYGQIPRGVRAEKHRSAARWIESLGRPDDHAEMLAHHYLHALELSRATGQQIDDIADAARTAIRNAGDRASSLNSFAAAVGFYDEALGLGPTGAERADVLFRRARAAFLIGSEDRGAALDEAREALLATGDAERAAQADALLAEFWWHRGDRKRSLEHLARARSLVEGLPSSPGKVHVLAQEARLRELAEDHEEAIRIGTAALAMSEELGLEEVTAFVLDTLGPAKVNLGDLSGLADLERGVEIAVAIRSPEAARAYNNLCATTWILGDFRRSCALLDEAIAASEQYGNSTTGKFSRIVKIQQLLPQGEWEDGLQRADEFLAACEAGEAHYLEASIRGNRAVARLALGDVEGALDDAALVAEPARSAADPQVLVPALANAARVYAEAGRLDDARALAREALSVPSQAWTLVDLAWFADELDCARRLRERLAESDVRTKWEEAANTILDDDLVGAADVLAEIGDRPLEAFARLRAAGQLLSEDRRAEADEQLQKSLAFWRSVGATRYIREGEALLAATA
jgi:tetratricopeptide (TPR) repeat protein